MNKWRDRDVVCKVLLGQCHAAMVAYDIIKGKIWRCNGMLMFIACLPRRTSLDARRLDDSTCADSVAFVTSAVAFMKSCVFGHCCSLAPNKTCQLSSQLVHRRQAISDVGSGLAAEVTPDRWACREQ